MSFTVFNVSRDLLHTSCSRCCCQFEIITVQGIASLKWWNVHIFFSRYFILVAWIYFRNYKTYSQFKVLRQGRKCLSSIVNTVAANGLGVQGPKMVSWRYWWLGTTIRELACSTKWGRAKGGLAWRRWHNTGVGFASMRYKSLSVYCL